MARSSLGAIWVPTLCLEPIARFLVTRLLKLPDSLTVALVDPGPARDEILKRGQWLYG